MLYNTSYPTMEGKYFFPEINFSIGEYFYFFSIIIIFLFQIHWQSLLWILIQCLDKWWRILQRSGQLTSGLPSKYLVMFLCLAVGASFWMTWRPMFGWTSVICKPLPPSWQPHHRRTPSLLIISLLIISFQASMETTSSNIREASRY